MDLSVWGNMGASLAKAVLQAKTCDDILLANRSQAKVDAFIANFGGRLPAMKRFLQKQM